MVRREVARGQSGRGRGPRGRGGRRRSRGKTRNLPAAARGADGIRGGGGPAAAARGEEAREGEEEFNDEVHQNRIRLRARSECHSTAFFSLLSILALCLCLSTLFFFSHSLPYLISVYFLSYLSFSTLSSLSFCSLYCLLSLSLCLFFSLTSRYPLSLSFSSSHGAGQELCNNCQNRPLTPLSGDSVRRRGAGR